MQPELLVHLGLVGGVGLTEHGQQSAESIDQAPDLVPAHPVTAAAPVLDPGQFGFGCHALGLDLTAPGGDQGGVRSRLQRGAVAGELAVVLLQVPARCPHPGVGVGLRLLHHGEGVLDALRGEGIGQPGVQRLQDGVLAHVNGQHLMVQLPTGITSRGHQRKTQHRSYRR
ncbi:hypothetical protein [Streptomyces javensis]|uniref:hypothetical protein n=1 Tax=Streptomyces javensis TaxID=114698 RepID=UPI0031F95C0E